MIGWLKHFSFICALFIGVWACNGAETSNTETSDADSKKEDDQEGTDEPAWVNSMYLICDWQSVESRSQVGVACAIASNNPAFSQASLGIVDRHWKTVDIAGKTVSSEGRKEGEKNIFILNAQTIVGLAPQVTLSDGTFDKVITTRFEDLLEGLKKGGKLDACFNAEISIDDCFKAMGINLPNGDRYSNATSVKPEDSACANKDSLPSGVPCEVSSDAMAGDLDQARDWYMEGNDLITADGILKSEDFCDAKGIKPSAPRGTTSIKTRWYPYWKVGARPCFTSFKVNGHPPAYEKKFVVFDQNDGVGGEPFCAFTLLAEPTIFGGKLLRLHIFKNPKLFPDAAMGKEATISSIESFAEHFACTP